MPTEMEKTFLEKFGTIIIASYALIQPWIIYLWKRYIKPGKIEFYETGNIEIGFSSFASTIGLNGTLFSVNKDLFVPKINLEVLKLKDSSVHKFEWGFFRDTKLKLSGSNDIEVELPYGLLLSINSPQRLNIQFHDRAQQSNLSGTYNKLVKDWNDYLDNCFPYENRRVDPEVNIKIFQVYQDFLKTKEERDAYTKFDREFYWEPSDYQLKLCITTSRPNKVYEKTYQFTLVDEECERLRYNVITLIDLACGQHRFDWNFTNTNYKKAGA